MADQGSWTDEQLRQREADRLALAKEVPDQSPVEKAPIPGFDQPVDTSFAGDLPGTSAPAQSGMNADPYQAPQPPVAPQAQPVESTQQEAPTPASPAAAPQPQAPAPAPVKPPSLISNPADVAAQFKAENAAWGTDLQQGHITPETYESLFAKKDTLGKIGTIFGLMMSGAGSGLTHQPNAMLEMMNKQISNDFDAQKESATNARNYYQLNMQHQKQMSDIKKQDYDNALTQAQTLQVPIQSQLYKAQTRAFDAETAIKARTNSMLNMNSAALQSLVDEVNKSPPGSPERANAEQKLALVATAVNNENYSLIDRGVAQIAFMHAVTGANGGASGVGQGDTDEKQFQKDQLLLRMNGHKDLADDNESKHIPGIPGKASAALPEEVKTKVQSGKELIEVLNRLEAFTNKHAGTLPDSPKNVAIINQGRTLADSARRAYQQAQFGGVFRDSEKGFIDQAIPDPTQFLPEARTLSKIKTIQSEAQQRTNSLLKSRGLGELPGGAASHQSNTESPKYSEGDTGIQKSTGKPIIFTNGKWKLK